MIFELKRSYDFYRTLKKSVLKNSGYFFGINKMKDKKKFEVLLKVLQNLFNEKPKMQEVINVSMVEIRAEEGVSPEQVFFILLFLMLSFL